MDPLFVAKTAEMVKKHKACNTNLKRAKTARSIFLHINRNRHVQYTLKSDRFWTMVDTTRNKLMDELTLLQTTEKCASTVKYYKIVHRTLELYGLSSAYKKSIALSLNYLLPGALCANIMEYI